MTLRWYNRTIPQLLDLWRVSIVNWALRNYAKRPMTVEQVGILANIVRKDRNYIVIDKENSTTERTVAVVVVLKPMSLYVIHDTDLTEDYTCLPGDAVNLGPGPALVGRACPVLRFHMQTLQ